MKSKLKIFIYYLSILLCFTYICTSAYFQIKIYNFNCSNIKSNIEFLTSPKCEGRLAGTTGNLLASNLIENSFKDSKLLPYKNNSYKESFSLICPTCNNQKPKLLIKNSNNKIVKEYKYGIDYKEDMVNFRTSSVDIDRMDNVTVCLDSIIVLQGTHKYLFKISDQSRFKFRSSFNANSDCDFCIDINSELYNDILNSLREDNILSITLPYSTSPKYGCNIIGKIKGTSSTLPPLILCAHYDHLGTDYLGNCYSGALDNASGTAFLLELSKYFSSTVKPERDIIFIAFTGEEFGLLGSKQFIKDNFSSIQDSTVINFDMIGVSDTPITIMNGFNTSEYEKQNSLIDTIKNSCNKSNLNYVVSYKDSSDHASFCNVKIPAVTLCYSDTTKIHTPDDKIEYLDKEAFTNTFNMIKPVIYDLSYNKYFLILYSYKITLAFCLILLLLICTKKAIKA